MDGETRQHIGDEPNFDADSAALERHIDNLAGLDESRPLVAEAKIAISEIMPRISGIKAEIEAVLATKDIDALAKKVQEAELELDNLRAYLQSLINSDERCLALKDGVDIQQAKGVMSFSEDSVAAIEENRSRCQKMLDEVLKVAQTIQKFKGMIESIKSRR